MSRLECSYPAPLCPPAWQKKQRQKRHKQQKTHQYSRWSWWKHIPLRRPSGRSAAFPESACALYSRCSWMCLLVCWLSSNSIGKAQATQKQAAEKSKNTKQRAGAKVYAQQFLQVDL